MVSKREHKTKPHSRNVKKHSATAWKIAVLIMMLSGRMRLHVTVGVFQKAYISSVFLDHLYFLMHCAPLKHAPKGEPKLFQICLSLATTAGNGKHLCATAPAESLNLKPLWLTRGETIKAKPSKRFTLTWNLSMPQANGLANGLILLSSWATEAIALNLFSDFTGC